MTTKYINGLKFWNKPRTLIHFPFLTALKKITRQHIGSLVLQIQFNFGKQNTNPDPIVFQYILKENFLF